MTLIYKRLCTDLQKKIDRYVHEMRFCDVIKHLNYYITKTKGDWLLEEMSNGINDCAYVNKFLFHVEISPSYSHRRMKNRMNRGYKIWKMHKDYAKYGKRLTVLQSYYGFP